MDLDFEATRCLWAPTPRKPTLRQLMVERTKSGPGTLTEKAAVGVIAPRKTKPPASKGWPKLPKSLKNLCPVDNFVCVRKLRTPHFNRDKGNVSPTCRPLRKGKICLEGCRYEIVRATAKEVGFTETGPTDSWNIMWTDVPVTVERPLGTRQLTDITASLWRFPGTSYQYQRANHFPGTVEFCRKDSLSRNLGRMSSTFPGEFAFFPKTWHIPADYRKLKLYCQKNLQAILICKPEAGSQGRGIFLSKNLDKIEETRKMVCQVYIRNPLLIDGLKFDLRIYVLITSYDPLRVYVYNEGLARFATMKYRDPADDNMLLSYMHLTNYSVNKCSQAFVPEESSNSGSKRKMSTVLQSLLERGYNVVKLIEEMDDIIIKTIISSQPALVHYYRNTFPDYKNGCACFEVIGFDILLDTNLKPWLLEANLSPSYVVDLPIDSEVKEQLLRDTFHMIHLGEGVERTRKTRLDTAHDGSNRRQSAGAEPKPAPPRDMAGKFLTKELEAQFKFENDNMKNYRLIYPIDGCVKYRHLMGQPMDNLYPKSPALSLLERTPDLSDRNRYARK